MTDSLFAVQSDYTSPTQLVPCSSASLTTPLERERKKNMTTWDGW